MRKPYFIVCVVLLLVAIADSRVTDTAAQAKGPNCELHRIALKSETLEIVYGLILLPYDYKAYDRALKRTFPHANSVVYGGCVIHQHSPRTQTVMYCDSCRAAERKWLNTHRRR